MSLITSQRIRLMVECSQMGSINDVFTSATPQFWNGVDVQFELAFFYGGALASIANISSITVEIKREDPRTGTPLMSQTIASGSMNTGLTLGAWNDGAAADCHVLAVFGNSQNQFVFSGTRESYWLVVSGITNDTPGHKLVFGATPITVWESGFGTAAATFVASPSFYTAPQSDARFQRSLLPTAPASSSAAGVPGSLATDGNYLYLCTAANTWKRIALATY